MSRGYVVLFVKARKKLSDKTREIISNFQKYKIKYILVDLSEQIELYGNKVTLEGAFAIDFSDNGKVKVPITPLATADDKLFNGAEEINKNLEYLKENYSEE
jgi:hypothetical protein